MSDPQIVTDLAPDGAWHVLMRHGDDGVLTPETTRALDAAFRDVPAEARCMVLEAEGLDFCAGRVSPTPKAGARVGYSDLRARVADPVLDFYATLHAVPVPVIAAVRGRALGVGCALAGLADLVLADETARFGIPEMDRDIPPLLVMTALADRVPRAQLSRLVLTRQSVGAEEAVAMGLAGLYCPGAALAETLAQTRASLSANTPAVTRTVKRFLSLGPELGFAQRREYAATANPAAMTERFLPD